MAILITALYAEHYLGTTTIHGHDHSFAPMAQLHKLLLVLSFNLEFINVHFEYTRNAMINKDILSPGRL